MSAEKLIFRLGFYSPERLDCGIIEIRGANISIAFVPAPKVFLQQEIVGSGNVIVLIGFNTPGTVL